ncbi:hypothetical protein OY671_009497, partial [Metschnikowia pulcherrima]
GDPSDRGTTSSTRTCARRRHCQRARICARRSFPTTIRSAASPSRMSPNPPVSRSRRFPAFSTRNATSARKRASASRNPSRSATILP